MSRSRFTCIGSNRRQHRAALRSIFISSFTGRVVDFQIADARFCHYGEDSKRRKGDRVLVGDKTLGYEMVRRASERMQ